MALGGIEDDAELSFADTRARDELRQRRIDSEPRILEIDRIDRMLGDRHLDARSPDDALAAEADDTRQPPARAAFDDAVEIDEADRFTVAIRVRDAGTKTTGHERQVRVGVLRLA